MTVDETPPAGPPDRQTNLRVDATTDDAELPALEAAVLAELSLPLDGHVIGTPVTVTRIWHSGLPRVGLIATCWREECSYDVNLADVVFPPGSTGARAVSRYRAWLGFRADPEEAGAVPGRRPHKVASADIVVGEPIELIVLARKSNALRCRLLGTAREVTLRTAVRDEIPGSIITVTPKKHWTHARHPYVSGEVAAVRIDAAALGLVPLALHREVDSHAAAGSEGGARGERLEYRLERIVPVESAGEGEERLCDAQALIDDGEYADAEELLAKLLVLDLRCLDAHAMLGERFIRHWPSLALHHFELGVAIGALTIGEEFGGVLSWRCLDNRPFLRCLHGMARTLHHLGRADAAALAYRRLVRLDPADCLLARASLAALESGKTWKELEGGP